VDASLFFDGTNATPFSIWRFETDIEMFTNGSSRPDAQRYLAGWTTPEIPESTNNWSGGNIVRLASPEFDDRHTQLSATPYGDPTRDDRVIQLNDIIVDYSIIPLVNRGNVSAFANSIAGRGDLNGWDSEYWNIEDWTRGSDRFIDDDGNIFEADIEWMADQGITKGCNPPVNNKFCPNDNVTRGQMAAFLVRALGYTDNGGGDLFVDDDGNTFENDIDKLGTAGVTKGCNPPVNDRFCPNDFVTRGQMAAFLHRALG